MATVQKEVTKEKEYTEHVAKAVYVDGSEEEIVFDEMQRNEHCIILEEYLGLTKKKHRGCGHRREATTYQGFDAQKFATISMHGLKKFETIERRDESFEYTETKQEEKKAEEVEEDEEVIETFNREVRK